MNTIEIIIRRPVHQKVQEWLYRIGLFVVLSLMVYANFSDLKRYTVVDKVMVLFGIK